MKELSERQTAVFCGLGGTLGVAIMYIFKPPFLSSFANSAESLLEFLLFWWLLCVIGGLVMRQLKFSSFKSDRGTQE